MRIKLKCRKFKMERKYSSEMLTPGTSEGQGRSRQQPHNPSPRWHVGDWRGTMSNAGRRTLGWR
jgi:hypothetical protein